MVNQSAMTTRLRQLAALVGVAALAVAVAAGSSPAIAQSLDGEPCGPLTAYGSCEGTVLRFCQDERVVELDCAVVLSELPGVACGLVDSSWGYDCVAGDGTCANDNLTNLVPCPVDADGNLQGCTGDAVRFGCRPVSGPCVEADLPACDGELRLDYCGVADQPIGVHCDYFSQVCSPEYAECVDPEPTVGDCQYPPQRLHIVRDAQVADFAALNCDTVAGELRIEGGDVTSLVGLEALTAVTGNLVILNTVALTSLDGLQNLRSVGGELIIQRNVALLDLAGLRRLEVAHRNVTIGFNEALTATAGLERLAPVDALLSVVENTALVRLDGLDEMTALVDVSIRGNDNLNAITGLRMLQQVEQGFAVVDNPALVGIVGLSRLETLGGSLIISNNPMLDEALSLAGIDAIGQSVVFADNTSLPVWPLVFLRTLGGNLSALGNTRMPACEVDAAAEALRANGWTGQLVNNGNDAAAACF